MKDFPGVDELAKKFSNYIDEVIIQSFGKALKEGVDFPEHAGDNLTKEELNKIWEDKIGVTYLDYLPTEEGYVADRTKRDVEENVGPFSEMGT